MERLLLDRNVIAHRATLGREIAGFILSRRAADEAEILSVAVARRRQGRGVARRLLDLHLRRLAGLGASTVFLEVERQCCGTAAIRARGLPRGGAAARLLPAGERAAAGRRGAAARPLIDRARGMAYL